jgi:hypothetical protein
VLRRLSRIIGRRGAILLSYGVVWSVIGYGQLISPQVDRRGLTMLLNIMPLQAWGWCWISAGLIAAVCAILPQGFDWPAFLALPLMAFAWMLSYLVAWWPLDVFPRGWVAAGVYGALAVPVIVVAGWREPPRPKRVGPPYES